MNMILAQAVAGTSEPVAAAEPAVTSASSAAVVAPVDTAGQLHNLFQSVTGMFASPDVLAQPARLVDQLAQLGAVWAVMFLVIGVLCLLNGYRFYRIATVGLALMVGMFGGYMAGQYVQAPFIVAGCGGVLLAVVAMPLMKFAVAIAGGLAGAFIGANAWSSFTALAGTGDPAECWIGAMAGLVVLGMAAFVLFKLTVVTFTSVSGATIAVLGCIALLLQVGPWQAALIESLTAHAVVVPLLVAAPAVIGMVIQSQAKGGEATPA